MIQDRRQLGQAGEALAAEALKNRGYKILTRNYRAPCGEIDLIARHGDTLVFIEVKLRRSGTYGAASEAITGTKRRRISRSAQFYLRKHGSLDMKVRFDVVTIDFTRGQPEVDIIPGAFEA
ncbi:MAG: YraN family protein [Deltaproteobacteria bacterium]|nr:YraN family protein [Deltaproteobacteria bacterium]